MSVGIADSPDSAGRIKVCERSLCRSKFKVHTGLVSVQLGKVTDLRGKPGPGPSDGFLESGSSSRCLKFRTGWVTALQRSIDNSIARIEDGAREVA